MERLGQWRRECLAAQMVRAQDLTTRFWFVTTEMRSLIEEQCVSQKTENRFPERLEQGTVVRKGRSGWCHHSHIYTHTTHTTTVTD